MGRLKNIVHVRLAILKIQNLDCFVSLWIHQKRTDGRAKSSAFGNGWGQHGVLWREIIFFSIKTLLLATYDKDAEMKQ